MDNKKERVKNLLLEKADFTNVFQAKTAWEQGFDACWDMVNRKHIYWNAGEPDCPRDIKAPNGELHTLRCKVCGQERDTGFCEGPND